MKKYILAAMLLASSSVYAQHNGGNFGFGLILGDPTGITVKYWTARTTAFDGAIGSSSFGRVRIHGDYLWHFNAFNSQIVNLYAGLGIAIGFGEPGGWYKYGKNFYRYEGDGTRFGLRGDFGINVIPRATPIELFLEVAPIIGISPAFGFPSPDIALGIRFYP